MGTPDVRSSRDSTGPVRRSVLQPLRGAGLPGRRPRPRGRSAGVPRGLRGLRGGAGGGLPAAARARCRVPRGQLRGGHRVRADRLRLRLHRRRRQRLRPDRLRLHLRPHLARVRGVDAHPAHRAPRDPRRRRHALGARLDAGPQRLLVGVPRRRRPPAARRHLRRRRRVLHPLRAAVDPAGRPLRRRRDPRGQRRGARPSGQRRRPQRLVRPARRRRRPGGRRAGRAGLRLARPGRVDPRCGPARGLRRVGGDRLADHLPGDPPAGGTLSRPVPALQVGAAHLRRCRRLLGRRARRARRRAAGDAAVRLRAVPAAAVGLHELPLQPGLRLLLGGVLAAGAAAPARDRPVRGAGGRRGRRGVHRALRDRRRAVPRTRPGRHAPAGHRAPRRGVPDQRDALPRPPRRTARGASPAATA